MLYNLIHLIYAFLKSWINKQIHKCENQQFIYLNQLTTKIIGRENVLKTYNEKREQFRIQTSIINVTNNNNNTNCNNKYILFLRKTLSIRLIKKIKSNKYL